MDFNKVILIGRLTRDLELRTIGSSGTPVTDLGVAVNHKYKNKSGELVEEVSFIDCTVFGRQAETCHQYLSKGSGVLVEGRLKMDSWETQEGQKRTKLKVVADRVQFLPRSQGAGGGERREPVSDYGQAFGSSGSGSSGGGGQDSEYGAEGTYHDDSVPF